ncbi:hypothetical protein B7494_g5808 [Chlorociboria aeruginascens]|nr:hypothetical protein B7494_g5808 [Chlorociboria aeruginascens]
MSTAMGIEMGQDILLDSDIERGYTMSTPSTTKVAPHTAAAPFQGDSSVTIPVDEAPEDETDFPQSTLSFRMNEEAFRKARHSPLGAHESFWTHLLYRGPLQDGVEQKVRVHYCKSKHTAERTMQYFQDKKVLGFDIEWMAQASAGQGAKKNVSLIQIASEDRIALIHLAVFPKNETSDLVPPLLKKIMEDAEITKVGVAIKGDCTRLRKHLGIHSRGLFELSHLYKLVKYSASGDLNLINKRLVSLSTQVEEHLHLPLFKGEVRTGDWSSPLHYSQIIYAAADTYAGIHLYDVLEIKRKALDPTPPRPYHAEEEKPIRLASGAIIQAEEASDELEPEDQPARVLDPNLPPSYLASAKETLELDPDFEIPIPVKREDLSDPRSPELQARIIPPAELLVQKFRQEHPGRRTNPASLRAYFIWYHNPDMAVPEIAALLRAVPLQTNTVVTYILDAVRGEKLPFEKARLREVLDYLPKDVVQSRWRGLMKAASEETNGGKGDGDKD